jgi:hypothetical protein
MPDFNAQNTDAENAKAAPKCTARDNDLKKSSRGSLQSIAGEGGSGQQQDTGAGGEAVTASRK